MITVFGNNVRMDIEVDGQRLDSNGKDGFVEKNGVEIHAYRMVYTSGFALPTFQLIMSSFNEEYLKKFNEQNEIKIFAGTDPNRMDCFTCETIGKHIKRDAQEAKFLLYWGGVLSKNKLNSKFLKEKGEGIHIGNSLWAMQLAYKEYTGCSTKLQIGQVDKSVEKNWMRNGRLLNDYLVDIYLHVDLRPSFPLATITKDGDLLIRDFQTLKAGGPTATFAPASKGLKSGEIPYVGIPGMSSFKTYTNRYCGYIQKTGKNLSTGKVTTVANSVSVDGWSKNTLAITRANESNPTEHQSGDSSNVIITDSNPVSAIETELYNKTQLLNMSSIQARVRVDGRYINNVNVLDLVELKTGRNGDSISGKYIVEAIEQGFVDGTPWSNNFYMCRDNFNDVENSQSDLKKKLAMKQLRINPSTRAGLINAIRGSRRSLIFAQGIMGKQYMNEFEKQLISMRRGFLSNFDLNGTTIDFNDMNSTVNTLKSGCLSLVNTIISKFVSSPYDKMLYNVLTKSSSLMNLFMGLLSGVLGADIYGEFSQLIGDAKMFYTFLDNYNKTINVAQNIYNDTYVQETTTGHLAFTETPSGNLVFEDTRNIPTLDSIKDDNMNYTDEDKDKVINKVIDEIKENIPDSVDLPIPEIKLEDSDMVKNPDEIKDNIIDEIVKDLINQGYIYDSSIYDGQNVATNITFMKPDGTNISLEETRRSVLSSAVMKSILSGNQSFDTVSAAKIRAVTGSDLHVRHWGTFDTEADLASFNINSGYVEKYRTLNCMKALSVRGGKRIYVALPASEKNVRFYINSARVVMGETEYSDLGYKDYRGYPIPYIVYYTTEYYNSSNLTLELRRGT